MVTIKECLPDCPLKSDLKPKAKELENSDECDLRCTKERKTVDYVEYVGPVHITLIDPPGYVYRRTMLETGLVNMAYFLIGSTVMFILYYTLSFKHYWAMNCHILLGTLGSQIFMPAFFLILHHLHGPGIYLKSKDKRKEACLMNCLGVLCIWLATIFLYAYKDYFLKVSVHALTGLIGTVASIVNLLTAGCLFADEDSKLGRIAQVLCIPAYVMLTISFITGMFKPSIVKWYPEKHIPSFLTVFCVLYVLIILFRPVKNFLQLM